MRDFGAETRKSPVLPYLAEPISSRKLGSARLVTPMTRPMLLPWASLIGTISVKTGRPLFGLMTGSGNCGWPVFNPCSMNS